MTVSEFNQQNAIASFKKIMDFKGEIAPIAEKACRNFELKTKNPVNKHQRLHYFAVGHAFKQLDTEHVFGLVLDDAEKKKVATQNISLRKDRFNDDFISELNSILGDIRNLNSHYVHSFEKVKADAINANMQEFIFQSFELAVLQVYLKEENFKREIHKSEALTYAELIALPGLDKVIVKYLYDKFFPLDKEKEKENADDSTELKAYKELRKHFGTISTKAEAIETLLFVELPEEKDWTLYGQHKLFTISAGKYLSFYGNLFLLSLFLYKSEANQLISKIKGFKKNETPAEQSKRDIFTFFSKKFSSQDINSEENHLVKFRDIIQYLNHYPVEWTKKMELESDVPLLTDRLNDKIIEMEIDRAYPLEEGEIRDRERFHTYARHAIWGKKHLGKAIETKYINTPFTEKELERFYYIIYTSSELKNAELNLIKEKASYSKTYSDKDKKTVEKTEKLIKELKAKNELNTITDRLQKRIAQNMLYVSYGRNQDRFMDFAARYLAEQNYFGADAEFKLYKYFDTEEQNEYVNSFELPKDKKVYDKLAFHQGKLTHFSSWSQHLLNYPEWDMPFVLENNAIQVKVRLGEVQKTVSIQRALMVYLLEDALFHSQQNIVEAGQALLTNYYYLHKNEFAQSKSILETVDAITVEQKTSMKKLLPKRLLHHYSPAVSNGLVSTSPLRLVLDKAKEAEKRYSLLREKAQKEQHLEDFLKRNKGKQFKLQFVRKAWHLMYFKESYRKQVEQAGGHHKQFHITRDEFNDFCRYLFAFDEQPAYKIYLQQLFEEKGFLENKSFKSLFDSAASLDVLYQKTKGLYLEWLQQQEAQSVANDKYTLKGYKDLFADEMFYINLSHFIKHSRINKKLDPEKTGRLRFKALQNKDFLIANYYTEVSTLNRGKAYKKMFNDLQTSCLEDVMLYEIALNYLLKSDKHISKSNVKTNVLEIQKSEINFDFKDGETMLFKLIVPFKNLDRYAGVKVHRDESYWQKMLIYLQKVESNKDMKPIYSSYKHTKCISLDEWNKINSHFIRSAINFCKLELSLEAYFILKEKTLIKNDINIIYEEILPLSAYFTKDERNIAFHFDIQEKTYEELQASVEPLFISNEVKPEQPKSYQDIFAPQRQVCDILLSNLHDNFYGKEKDGKKKRKEAQDRYFKEIISKA